MVYTKGCFIYLIVFLLQSPTPGPYIKEMLDAAQFYMNRVLKEYKDKLVSVSLDNINTRPMCTNSEQVL